MEKLNVSTEQQEESMRLLKELEQKMTHMNACVFGFCYLQLYFSLQLLHMQGEYETVIKMSRDLIDLCS